jgi:hypothetical protein
MWQGVDATYAHHMPIRQNMPSASIFFILFIIAGALFIINLFIGVVLQNFSEQKMLLMREDCLTQLQIEYTSTMINCYKAKPIAQYKLTGYKCKDNMHLLASHRNFDNFIMLCIILNTACMTVTWYRQEESLHNLFENINFAFTIVYTIEAIIKLYVFRKTYFRDGWNVFDFTIVVSAWIGFVIEKLF